MLVILLGLNLLGLYKFELVENTKVKLKVSVRTAFFYNLNNVLENFAHSLNLLALSQRKNFS